MRTLHPIVPGAQYLVGIHLLEMAKTTWNQHITELAADRPDEVLVARVRLYLELSSDILHTMGREGDDGGPLSEAQTLQMLLDEATQHAVG